MREELDSEALKLSGAGWSVVRLKQNRNLIGSHDRKSTISFLCCRPINFTMSLRLRVASADELLIG